jgi:murein DD-endopeptidase MepM/ murein hydrolase activator NlpD
VALVGRTGNATTDHVHFEVREQRVAVDPVRFFAPENVAALQLAPSSIAPGAATPVSGKASR